MVDAEKLEAARELLERAQHVPEGERLWLVTLAWSQVREIADEIGRSTSHPATTSIARRGIRGSLTAASGDVAACHRDALP